MNKRLPKWNVGAERFETRSAEPRQLANEAVGYAGASTAAQSGKLQGVRSAECPSPLCISHKECVAERGVTHLKPAERWRNAFQVIVLHGNHRGLLAACGGSYL